LTPIARKTFLRYPHFEKPPLKAITVVPCRFSGNHVFTSDVHEKISLFVKLSDKVHRSRWK
jgi:hypothetical protein